ncbi:hypothetical protein V2J09_008723 [Rumex salicifolius]
MINLQQVLDQYKFAEVAQIIVADMATYLAMMPGLPQSVIGQISDWSLVLQGLAPLRPRPIPRADQGVQEEGDDGGDGH